MGTALIAFNHLPIELRLNLILAIVAVVGFLSSFYFSVKSNNNLNQQIKLQNHPILKLKVVEEKRSERILAIENIGTGTALNVMYIAGAIEEQKGFRSIKPEDPKSIGSLGVHEKGWVDESERFLSTFLQYAKENTDRKIIKHSLVYYDDILGNSYVTEARLLLEFNNIQLLDSFSPREVSKKELKSLVKKNYKESKLSRQQGQISKAWSYITDNIKRNAGGKNE